MNRAEASALTRPRWRLGPVVMEKGIVIRMG